MTDAQKTAGQIAAERIMSMPLHPDYKPVINLPIPLHNGVLIKEVARPAVITTSTGIMMPTSKAENTQEYQEGILMAVGPKCSEFLRIGLKYQFSSYVDTFFWHEGIRYYKLDETLIYYAVPDPRTLVDNGHKDAKEVRRGKKMKESDSRLIRMHDAEMNEKDQKIEKASGRKTFKMK